jgi:hypothetical protein
MLYFESTVLSAEGAFISGLNRITLGSEYAISVEVRLPGTAYVVVGLSSRDAVVSAPTIEVLDAGWEVTASSCGEIGDLAGAACFLVRWLAAGPRLWLEPTR